MADFLRRNQLVTITPGFGDVAEHLSQFRWGLQVSLPYPFPLSKCYKDSTEIAGTRFDVSIHNHFDRVIETVRAKDDGRPYFRVRLEDNRVSREGKPDGPAVRREVLQSVVLFEEAVEYETPSEAFGRVESKIKSCLEWLAAFLSSCQRAAPYHVAWLVYPISLFDVGVVYHEVTAFCARHDRREPFASGVAISLARQLQRPMFALDLPLGDAEDSPMATTNELLAEAQMSLFRGMPRLTVLNSYAAVESLANIVFVETKVANLKGHNVPADIATGLVEDERKRHRTEPQFLYHKGIKEASGRSLKDENKKQYDAIIELQGMRHRVAHTGYRPTDEEAREAFEVSCEVASWLGSVAGFHTKPLVPSAENSYPGLSAGFSDAHARSMPEVELVRHLLSVPPASDVGPGQCGGAGGA